MQKNIIFCGLPKSGKTTIGQRLAKKLGCCFIDTDRRIEEAHPLRKSCREIFQEHGEEAFRFLESKEIASLRDINGSVIALGGGALDLFENRAIIEKLGKIIYLKVDPKIIFERILTQKILPAYLDTNTPEKTFFSLCEKRIHIYERIASIIVEEDLLSDDESDLQSLCVQLL